MMKVIVTGHGHFATGLASTVKLLAGELADVHYVDFTEELSENDLAAKFPKENDVVFFCDLAGGTPYKQAAIISSQFDNVAVIAGCNIAALLEVGLSDGVDSFISADILADKLISASQAAITKFQAQKYQEDVEEDGI